MQHRNDKTAKSIASFWGKSLKDQDWYSVDTSAGQTEVLIYDVIGWPFVDANAFTRDFNKIQSKEITIGINSPGGDVFDGTAIYNTIENHPAKITTRIDGVAASMASIIALAGDEIQIASNAYYMMHNPWSMSLGDHRDFQKESVLLARITDTLANTYAGKTGIELSKIKSMMDDETWLIGKELVNQGFADKVIGESKTKARFDLSMFAKTPETIKGESVKTPLKTEREFEQLLTRDAGFSRSQARAIINSGFKSVIKQDANTDDIAALTNLIKQLETSNV